MIDRVLGLETSDRVINLAGTSGGAIIENDGSGPLVFSSSVTATAMGSKTLTLQGTSTDTNSLLGAWATLSPIRVILAPLLAIGVGLCALFAPTRFTRFAFLGAAAIETVVFVWVTFAWFQSIR